MTEEQAAQLLIDTGNMLTAVAASNELLQNLVLIGLALCGVALGCTVILVLAVMYK